MNLKQFFSTFFTGCFGCSGNGKVYAYAAPIGEGVITDPNVQMRCEVLQGWTPQMLAILATMLGLPKNATPIQVAEAYTRHKGEEDKKVHDLMTSVAMQVAEESKKKAAQQAAQQADLDALLERIGKLQEASK